MKSGALTMETESTLERAFAMRWDQLTRDLDVLPFQTQVRFNLERKYPFDCAWIDKLVFVELHGGGYVRGRHNREEGMVTDFTKYNLAVSMGWRGVYATTSMIHNNPEPVVGTILKLLSQPVLTPDAEYSMWEARVANLTHVGDSITNNGISVERLGSNKFLIKTGSGEFRLGGKMPLLEAQRQVLDFILRGRSAAATPANLVKLDTAFMKVLF